MARATIEAGLLVRGLVRNLVLYAKSQGYDVQLHEGSGWLSRPMLLEGDEKAIRWIYAELKARGMEEEGN